MNPVAMNPNESRREFLRGAGRVTLLGALGGLSVVLGRRAGVRFADPRCRARRLCDGCAAFDQCTLPAALKARRAQPGDVG